MTTGGLVLVPAETAATPSNSAADTETAAKSGEKPATKPSAKPAPVKDFSYNRLYFDFNHNGDLTEHKAIEAPADSQGFPSIISAVMWYARFRVSTDQRHDHVDGTKLDYSFSLEGYANFSASDGMVMVSVSSAICREGDITLEGKRHHVVLLDCNSNGRFDDENKIAENIRMASGQLYPEPGDMLLLDPKPGGLAYDSPYDATSSDYRCPVTKMVMIDGKWYHMKISPAGDKLTLTPTTAALGSVTSRNEAFPR